MKNYRSDTGQHRNTPGVTDIAPLVLPLTTPLYKMIRKQGGQVLGYINDINIFVSRPEHGKVERHRRRSVIRTSTWARKNAFIHFNGRRRNLPNVLQPLKLPNYEERKPPTPGEIAGYRTGQARLKHARSRVGQIWRHGGCYRGMSHPVIRQMYLSCVLTDDGIWT